MALNEGDEKVEYELQTSEPTEPTEPVEREEIFELTRDRRTTLSDEKYASNTVTDGKKKKKGKGRSKREASISEQQKSASANQEPGIEIEGVVKVTLNDLTQKILNCVVGEHVTQEMPWVFVRKDTVEDNIDLHEESSDFLPIKEDIKKFPGEKLLVGYDATAETANQFFVCVTEHAESSVLNILDKVRQEQQEKIKNAINKVVNPWKSLGSDKEVDETIIKNTRRLFEIEALTTIGQIRSPAQFSNRDVKDVYDGYKMFGVPRRKITTIERKRISTGVQAALLKQDSETQTVPGLPINAWTQYEYKVDSEALFADPVTAQEVEEFLVSMVEELSDMVEYNEIFDLLQNDYHPLVKDIRDTIKPVTVALKDFLTFVDVTNCKGKQVSSVAWNSLITGLVAVAYVKCVRWNEEDKENENEEKESPGSENKGDEDTSTPLVLLWSFNDTINPKLILESPSEVHKLSWCPVDANILLGGCANGQTIIWDITNRIEKVETEEVLTVAQKNYKLRLQELMTWMKEKKEEVYVEPTAMSSLQFTHKSCINGIQWLPTIWKVPTDGHVLFVEENEQPSMQFVTCSEDGSVQFWDLNAPIAAESGLLRPTRRKGGSRTRPAALSVDVSPLRKLNRMYRPSFMINMVLYTSDTTIPLAALNYKMPGVAYEDVNGGSLTVHRQMDRVLYRPVLPKFSPEDPPPPMEMLVGSGMGTFLKISWRGCDFNQVDRINFEPCDYVSCTSFHDGPVHTVTRCPFINDLILSVGGTVFAIWKEDMMDTPILMKNSNLTLTCGVWSIYRASLFYISREDGTLELWDVLKRTRAPIMLQSLSGKTIRELSSHALPLPYNTAAIADHNGSLRTYLLPICYQANDAGDLEKAVNFFNREMETIKLAKQWLSDWVKRNATLLEDRKAKIAEEARLKRERLEYMEKVRIEKKRAHEEAMARLMASNTHQQNIWRERAEERVKKERDLQLTKALMEKKRVRISDLTKKVAPMQALYDEKESNRVKIINRKRDAEKMFEDLVAVLFPETLEPGYQGLTPKEYLAQEFDPFTDLFEMQYRDLKEILVERRRRHLLAQQDKKVDTSVTLTKLILNGIERGRVLDTALTTREHHQERIKQYKQLTQVGTQKVALPVKMRTSQEEINITETEENEENKDDDDESTLLTADISQVVPEIPITMVDAAPVKATPAEVPEKTKTKEIDVVYKSVLSSSGQRDDALKEKIDEKLKLW